jgi:hypothetical protein
VVGAHTGHVAVVVGAFSDDDVPQRASTTEQQHSRSVAAPRIARVVDDIF